MNKDELKGKAKDVAGRVQRQAGEWTDNEEQQIKGGAKQVEGKIQEGVGKMKDAANKTMQDLERNRKKEGEQDVNRDINKDEEAA